MIGYLRGELLVKQPDRIILLVHGVGYDVHVPLSTFYGLREPGATIELRVHTHVREDALALFGFGTALELQIFERLIGISGIGPRLALGVLSGIEPAELVRAIERGDVARLTGIPGVGRKTAERMCLELKDRLRGIAASPEAVMGEVPGRQDLRGDLLSALLNLGYHRPLAEKAVDSALRTAADGGFEHTLKQALRELAR